MLFSYFPLLTNIFFLYKCNVYNLIHKYINISQLCIYIIESCSKINKQTKRKYSINNNKKKTMLTSMLKKKNQWHIFNVLFLI